MSKNAMHQTCDSTPPESCIEHFQPSRIKGYLREVEEHEEELRIFHKRIHLKEENITSSQQMESELAIAQTQIESLRKLLEDEKKQCDLLKHNKIPDKSHVRAQALKLITGFALAKSDGFYVGASIENPQQVFRCKTDDPHAASKLWTQIENN